MYMENSMQALFDELKGLLAGDARFAGSNGAGLLIMEDLARQADAGFLQLLLSGGLIRQHFFVNAGEVMVFDKMRFLQFLHSWPAGQTASGGRMGIAGTQEPVRLAWPYSGYVLEDGQTMEATPRQGICRNETLAAPEIARLFSPKALTGFLRYSSAGECPPERLSAKDNLIIRGNNLTVLHSLKKVCNGAVKLIYIDPPYNTGSSTFPYNDNFAHATWLTLIKNRLEAARDLLRDDGAIFVQIDYKEVAYLTVLMDEIFGRENMVQMIAVKTASPAGFKTINPGPVDVTEYILFYTKNRQHFRFRKNYVPVAYDSNYNLVITNPHDEPQQWQLEPLRDVICRENGIPLGHSPQQTGKNAREHWGPYWKVIRDQLMAAYALDYPENLVSIRDPHKPSPKLKKILELSKQHRNKVFVYEKEESGKYGYVMNGGALSFYANKIREIDGVKTPSELLTDFWKDISWDGIAKEGGVKLKNGKKPEKLIKRIIEMVVDSPDDLVLDFYLGSGTTAAVAHKMGLRYIGIEQLDYGENDSRVRLQHVINGDTTGISQAVQWKGGGSFVYCELAQGNGQDGHPGYIAYSEMSEKNFEMTEAEIILNRQFYGD